MRASLLADRYAQALRAAIADREKLETAAEILNVLSSLYHSNADFRHALTNPVLNIASRRRVLDAAIESQPTPPELAEILRVMLKRNRMTLLPLLAVQFENHINEWLNRVEVNVVTAVPLTRDLEAKLTQSMERFTEKTVRLKCKVDADIIGGLIVYLWGVFIDFSLRTRLERLKQKLLAEETLTYGN